MIVSICLNLYRIRRAENIRQIYDPPILEDNTELDAVSLSSRRFLAMLCTLEAPSDMRTSTLPKYYFLKAYKFHRLSTVGLDTERRGKQVSIQPKEEANAVLE